MVNEKNYIIRVGECIKELREEKELTRMSLANSALIPVETLAQIEMGEILPNNTTLFLLANVLDVYPESIIEANPRKRRSQEELENILDSIADLLTGILQVNKGYMEIIKDLMDEYPKIKTTVLDSVISAYDENSVDSSKDNLDKGEVEKKSEKKTKTKEEVAPNI